MLQRLTAQLVWQENISETAVEGNKHSNKHNIQGYHYHVESQFT